MKSVSPERPQAKTPQKSRFDMSAKTPSGTPWASLKSCLTPPPDTQTERESTLFVPKTVSGSKVSISQFGTFAGPVRKKLKLERVEEYFVDAAMAVKAAPARPVFPGAMPMYPCMYPPYPYMYIVPQPQNKPN